MASLLSYESLWAHILSFLDGSDLLSVLDCSQLLREAVGRMLASAESLHLSFLKQQNRRNKQQTIDANRLLELVSLPSLRYLECSGLSQLARIRLTATEQLRHFDLSGCSLLEPHSLHASLENCPNLRHLNLQGCVRLSNETLRTISDHLRCSSLRSLLLGGCSAAIENDAVIYLLQKQRHLQHLDLSGLSHLTDNIVPTLLTLSKLRSLSLYGCERMRLANLPVFRRQQLLNNEQHDGEMLMANTDDPNSVGWRNLVMLNFHNIGTPRRGLIEGALAMLSLSRMLREVNISGCEQVHDWEIMVLARCCGKTLTCVTMRACRVSNAALQALAGHCEALAELDASACFAITNGAVTEISRISSLRSLRVASLPLVSDIHSLSHLQELLLLDIHNCHKLTSRGVATTVQLLPSLIEVDARGIQDGSVTLFLRQGAPSGLCWVNNRQFRRRDNDKDPVSLLDCNSKICTVQTYSQRLRATSAVPLQRMMHCVDCQLVPALNRGVCTACAVTCHGGHETFLGSCTRFYCDCPFGIAGTGTKCKKTVKGPVQQENERKRKASEEGK